MQNDETIVESEQPAPEAEELKAESVAEGEAKEGDKPEETETPEQAEAKKQSKFQRRLERQKTARVAAETEARILRERLAQYEQQRQPAATDEEPKRENFEDYADYVKAVAKHEAKAAATATLKAQEEANEGRQRQSKAQESEDKIANEWVKREAAYKAANPEYEERAINFVEGDLQSFSQGSRRMMVESEVGPQLLDYLATHPDDAERIAELSPVRQIAELGKLEDKMSRPAKKASNAPPPPNPVKGGTSGSKDPAKMTVAEYAKWMSENGSRFVRKAA